MSCFFKFVNETISLKVRSTSSPKKKGKAVEYFICTENGQFEN